MSSDYNRQIVVAFDGKIPIDEHGHHLHSITPIESTQPWNYRKHKPYARFDSPRTIALRNVGQQNKLGNRRTFFWGTELTNPYGCLQWAVGNGDTFTCFDYAMLPDGRVILHATFNTESGCYIGGCGYEVVAAKDAPDVAMHFTDDGIDATSMNEMPHNKSGWNQDPYYFYRCVFLSCDPNLDTPNFSEREKRMGGKRINKYCNLPVDIHKAVW
jgi:hypothetical protein